MNILKIKDDYENKEVVTRVVAANDPSKKVEILSLSPWSAKVAIYGVNWQAIGSVSVAEAEEYVELLQAAIAEAKKRNSQ